MIDEPRSSGEYRATPQSTTLGCNGKYFDPLWRITTDLSAVETALLRSPSMRRLHHVAHAGASRLVTCQTYSRLEHTLGVFSLTAHFYPDDGALRVAALLHDIGHLPFSHTLEGLAGLDHHKITSRMIDAMVPLLVTYEVDAHEVACVTSGERNSVLFGRDGLNLDHLDSYIRSGRSNGWLHVDPAELLRALSITAGRLDVSTLALAEEIVNLMRQEAMAYCSETNVVSGWALRQLVTTILPSLNLTEFAAFTDDELWAVLAADKRTAELAHSLKVGTFKFRMREVEPDNPECNYSVRKLYTSEFLISGLPLARRAPGLAQVLEQIRHLPQSFDVKIVIA